ncbi:MAG TPA: glycosyl hydrolase family 28-related protein, partial [Pontiella sp.]|nr:glycosyl hydrolase family 28-related protein [Pontiella sp.]
MKALKAAAPNFSIPIKSPVLLLLLLAAFLAMPAMALLDINSYVDPIDREYVRIKCQFGSKYLYQAEGSNVVQYSSSIGVEDLRSHWYVKESPATGNYWIINRLSGEAMHVENQNGNIQMAALQSTWTSYRWNFLGDTDFFRIQSTWQPTEYMSLEDTATDVAGYDPLNSGWLSEKFTIESISPGATVPWITYDEYNYAAIGGGADVLAPTYFRDAIQAEAQNRSAILLDSYGAFTQWTLTDSADAFTLRYSIADAGGGGGLDGTISLYINGLLDRTVPVTSKQAWVYFDSSMTEYDAPGTGRRPAKRYNEARITFTSPLAAGTTIEFRRNSGDEMIWIDLLEAEMSETVTPSNPADFYDVTSYGAVANDGNDDRTAFVNCINAAKAAGKGVYIPAGVFHLSNKLDVSDILIMGAGIWKTELHFTNTANIAGGFNGTGPNVHLSDFYMKAPISSRIDYKALRGYLGSNSLLENIWVDQFTCGGWIADYTAPIDVTDGLTMRNLRIRNTFADGINLAKGTRNSVVENVHVRGSGDDGLASWSSDKATVSMCTNNVFRYNTVECNYRAGGIGIFGGEQHRIHDNVVQDVVSGPAIRMNTTFSDTG